MTSVERITGKQEVAVVLCKCCEGVRLVAIGDAVLEEGSRFAEAREQGHDVWSAYTERTPWEDRVMCDCGSMEG